MGLFDRQTTALEQAKAQIDTAVLALKDELAGLQAQRTAQKRIVDLEKERTNLLEQISGLKIEKSKLDEDNAREKREVMHMVGLERKRQEFEADQAKKGIEHAKAEAVLEVREENLQAERDAFEKHMEFQQKRFEQEVGYLKELMGEILERLPTVNVDRQIRERTTDTTTTEK